MMRVLATITVLCLGLSVTTEASAQSKVVDHLTMNQWVRPAEAGSLTGKVVLPTAAGEAKALQGVAVAMRKQNGDILRAKTDEQGNFTLTGVEPGVYAMTARGDNLFACCAMQVIDQTQAQEGKFPSTAEIAVANVDYTVVNTSVIRYMPPNVTLPAYSINDAQLDGLADRLCSNDVFRVARVAGGMQGQLHVAGAIGADLQGAEMTNVFLFKDGMEIDRTVTNSSGGFSFANTDTGGYSVLAIGPSGIGLLGFELVDESEQTASIGTDGTRLVGFGHHGEGCCQKFAMQVAPMPEVVCVSEEMVMAEPLPSEGVCCEEEIVDAEVAMDGCGCPLAGGGYASGGGYGGGGGGGGFGGGGGLVGLAGLAGIGAIIATTSDDDNNAIVPPVIASPVIPN